MKNILHLRGTSLKKTIILMMLFVLLLAFSPQANADIYPAPGAKTILTIIQNFELLNTPINNKSAKAVNLLLRFVIY